MHGDVGIGSGRAANRTCGRGRVYTELHLVRNQGLHAAIVHKEHDYVDRLAADLQSKCPAAEAVKRRSAPPLVRPAGDNALSVLASEAEPGLHHRGNNANAPGMRHDLLRHAFVGRRGDLIKDSSGFVEPISEPFTIAFVLCPAKCSENHECGDKGDKLLHEGPSLCVSVPTALLGPNEYESRKAMAFGQRLLPANQSRPASYSAERRPGNAPEISTNPLNILTASSVAVSNLGLCKT